jgi:hypothetical protein
MAEKSVTVLKRAISLTTLTLCAFIAMPAFGAEFQLPLAYNFNGMVHPGEAGLPDDPNGFRSISDRALIIDGNPGSFADMASPNSGLFYGIVNTPGTPDIVHIGNRNTVDGGNWAFDPAPDGDTQGIQPAWLPVPEQASTTNPISPGIVLDATSQIGLLYNASNGGGTFDVTLNFADTSSVTVTLHAPDWYGPFLSLPNPPGPGVSLQQNYPATYSGSSGTDLASADADLLITEAVITATDLLTDLAFDVSGRELIGITVDNRQPIGTPGFAIYAITVTDNTPGVLPTVTPVPTLSEWGMILLSSLLALGTIIALRRKRQ